MKLGLFGSAGLMKELMLHGLVVGYLAVSKRRRSGEEERRRSERLHDRRSQLYTSKNKTLEPRRIWKYCGETLEHQKPRVSSKRVLEVCRGMLSAVIIEGAGVLLILLQIFTLFFSHFFFNFQISQDASSNYFSYCLVFSFCSAFSYLCSTNYADHTITSATANR